MTYSITARREKARFLCSDLSIDDAEFWKRKLSIDGWTAIIIRDVSKPVHAAQTVTDALDGMEGIDEHKQTHNATDASFPLFLATCIIFSVALVGYLVYLAAFAFPAFGAVLQNVGWFTFAFALIVIAAATWKGVTK